MKFLATIFLVLGVYGIFNGKAGASILSFGMVFVVAYADRAFARQDREYMASPASARDQPDTIDILANKECECSESRFHGQVSEPDSKF